MKEALRIAGYAGTVLLLFGILSFALSGGFDLWTAVLAGLLAQQLSNDPGGDRWSVLLDRAVDMLIAELVRSPPTKATARRST